MTRDTRDLLLETGVALASELSLDAVLQKIVDVAVDVAQARYGALGVLGRGGVITRFVSHGLTPEEEREVGDPPRGRGVLGLLISDPKPLRLRRIEDHPQAVGFPPGHPNMGSFIGVPLMATGQVFGNLYLADKRGADEFTPEDEAALLTLAAQAGVAIANASLHEEGVRRERWLEGLRDVSTAILMGQPMTGVLDLVAGKARELSSADTSILVLPEGEESLRIVAADGVRAEALRGEWLPRQGTIAGRVMSTGRAYVFDDVRASRLGYPPLMARANMGSAVFTPLHYREGVAGVLICGNQLGRQPVDPDRVRLVQSFADQASVALEYGRAEERLRRLELMEERERISKELHDGAIQSLFAVGMGLQATADLVREPDLATRLEAAIGDLDQVILDLRNYIFGLRPGILADRQLDQALRDLVQDFRDRTGIRARVRIDSALCAALAHSASEVVQMVREALSNVSRHASATQVRLELRRRRQEAVLEVADDGAGFDPLTAIRGQGLNNMQARAARLGGSAIIVSRPGEGTRLTVTLPLERASRRPTAGVGGR